jgi:uncharacterized protein (DUF302 family)
MNSAEKTISIRHVSVFVDKPFEEMCSRFESRLGHINYRAFDEQVRRGISESAARDYVNRIAGPFGLMIFDIIDHGKLVGLAQKVLAARQYVVGNPLFALEMTKNDIRAGLYAPLRVYIRQAGPKKTVVEYDLPSSLFGQFENAEVNDTARMLDKKLEAAIDDSR